MLSPQVKQVVERLPPTEDIAFLVSIRLKDEMLRIAKVPDVAARKLMLFDLYQKVKQPLFDTISKYEDGGMRVINDLDGSPQMIVSGPAETWQRIISEGEASLSNPNVVFQANEQSWGLVD